MCRKDSSPERMYRSFGTEKKGVRISAIRPKFTAKNSSSGSASSARISPPASRCRSKRSLPCTPQYKSDSPSISGTKGQIVA